MIIILRISICPCLCLRKHLEPHAEPRFDPGLNWFCDNPNQINSEGANPGLIPEKINPIKDDPSLIRLSELGI